MLHVLFVILKIIGIILAALLGLLLLILLLVLFVPIRYKGRLCKGKELEAAAKVSWLLHIISVPVAFQNGTLSVKIKLFGITVKKLTEDEEELGTDAKELFQDMEDTVDRGEEHIEELEQQGESLRDTPSDKMGSHAVMEQERQSDVLKEEPSEEKETKDGAEPDWEEAEEKEESIFAKIKAFFLKILGIWKKIKNLKYTFRRFCGKIKKGVRKYRDIKEFLLDERTKGAIGKCFEQVKVLAGKLLPRKIRGELRFGTEDPALTGEILGGISIFYPIFMDNVKVYPDFEKSILEGELFVKGRFRLVTAALIFWRLWRDKNIRYVYGKWKSGS